MALWNGAVLISTDKMVTCPWNANEMDEAEFATLIEEIRDGGFDEPCQVVLIKDGDDAGKYLIIGGEHRYKASMALGFTEIPCVIKDHLSDADEAELMEWSVKRNHIRGRVNKEKYAAIEKRITGKWQISAEAARRRMLIREELSKSIKERFSKDVIDTMVGLEREALDAGGSPKTPSEEVDLSGSSPDRRRPPTDENEDDRSPMSDSQKDRKKAFADRRALLTSLKSFAQEVLQQSADTVEQGYLYFSIGGQTHLVVNESPALNNLIAEMVEACKANSDKINDFLASAIKKELPSWQ